jgi:hypothetical protein
MKIKNRFLFLLFSCFPLVQTYRLRKKIAAKRKKIYEKLHKEKNQQLKHYLLSTRSIRRL